LPIRGEYRATVVPGQPVFGQPAELGWVQHDVTLEGPLFQGVTDEWSASIRLREQDFDTDAVFPATGERFPEELWNIRLGTTYRHRFENGWIGGFSLGVGSPSDRPFASAAEVAVNANAVLRVRHQERHAWLFFLNYGSNREFLPHIPLPGLGYSYHPSDDLTAVVGTGFLSLDYRPIDRLTVRAYYAAVRTVDFRATYQVWRPVRVWAGFDWTNDRYLLAGRDDDDDRLFYYEKRVRAGVIIGLARQVFVDLAGGYAFDRFYFQGESYGDRDRNRLDVESGPFAAARLGLRF
jgi:hypothetical protein